MESKVVWIRSEDELPPFGVTVLAAQAAGSVVRLMHRRQFIGPKALPMGGATGGTFAFPSFWARLPAHPESQS